MNVIWKGSPNCNAGGNRPDKIVVHWMCGTLAACDATFSNPGREASAHYGVGPDEVHQYVREGDIAWHAGNGAANRTSIGIEHEGGPGWPPSKATLDRSAELMADIARRYGWGELTWMGNVFPHNHFSATSCPGDTDTAYLVAKANEILGNGSAGVEYGGSQATSAPQGGIPDVRYRVRSQAQGALPEMVNHFDPSGSGDGYAGDGSPILYLAIDMPGWYQVRTQRSGWLPRVYKYDINDLENGCAGDGSPITGVRCYYETLDPDATGWLRIEYAVANVGGSFFSSMQDLTDTGGSADDYAGNGGVISAFRAKLVRV